LLSPKQTGHANAARGAAMSPIVRSVFRNYNPFVFRWNAAP
jgi:hypothetical protein